MNGLKKRLEGTKGRWAEELPNILWAYQTTPRRFTGENPFSLTYGIEVVILAEVNLCSAWVSGFTLTENDEIMVKQLDLLEEYRELSTIWLAEYQQKLAWRYNREVKRREFSTRDLVLQKVVGNTQDVNAGKLPPLLGEKHIIWKIASPTMECSQFEKVLSLTIGV